MKVVRVSQKVAQSDISASAVAVGLAEVEVPVPTIPVPMTPVPMMPVPEGTVAEVVSSMTEEAPRVAVRKPEEPPMIVVPLPK